MARNLTAAMQTALESQTLKLFWLIDIAFATPLRLTTWQRDLVYSSNTYLSNVGVISLFNYEESLQTRIAEYTIDLSGANQANLTLALTEDFNDVEVVTYLGTFDGAGAIIADPIAIRGYVDSFSLYENIKTKESRVKWNISSNLANFDYYAGRRSNTTDQDKHYSGDTGFQHAGSTSANIAWGRS